jgi:hypothetical protein
MTRAITTQRWLRTLLAAALVAVVVVQGPTLPAGAASQIVGTEAFLQARYTEVGIRANGSLGSTTAAPAGFHARVDGLASDGVSLMLDRDKDGWGTGTDDGDFFLPGTPFEGWGIEVGGTVHVNTHTTTDIPGTFSNLITSGDNSVTWTADAPVGGIAVEQVYLTPRSDRLLHMDVTVTNTTAATLTNVYYWRGADPDNNQSFTGVFDTTNTIESQFFGTGLAAVSATQPDGSRIELRAADSRAVVAYQDGTFISTPTSLADIHDGTDPGYTTLSGATSTSNSPIDLVVAVGMLNPGTSVTFRVSYFLAEGADADLGVATSDPSPVTPGSDATITVSATNSGPDEAADTELVYTPPSGALIDAASLPVGCSGPAAGPITCTAGEVAIGATASYDLTIPVAADTAPGTTYTGGSLSATTSAIDADGASAVPDDIVVGDRIADLSLGATGPGDLIPGETGTVRLTVGSAGPSDAPATEVTYTPQVGVEVVTASLPVGCSGPAAGPIACDAGTLTSGASADIDIVVLVPPDAVPGTLYTGAAAHAASPDSTDDDGAAAVPSDITALGRQADLAVVATDPGPVVPGTSAVLDVDIDNLGPSDAPSTSVVVSAPPGVSFDTGSLPAGCGGTTSAVTCSAGTLPGSASTTFSIPIEVDPGAVPGTVLTGGDIDATTSASDPVTSNSTDQVFAVTTDTESSDIAVVAAPAGAVVPGETATVDVEVTNDGPSDTDDETTLTITPPSGVSFSAVPAGCSAGATDGDPITCTVAALANGATAAVSVTFDIASAAPGSSSLSGGAATITNPDDPNAANDASAFVLTTAVRESDLAVSAADPGPITPGAETDVTVTVTNAGPSDADGTTLVFTPPDGVSLDTANMDPACSVDTPVVGTATCALGAVAAGGNAVVDVAVAVDSDATPSSTLSGSGAADVTSDSIDADGAAAGVAVTTGPGSADLSVIVGSEPVLDPGESGALEFIVANLGPSDAAGAELSYTLPGDVEFDTAGANPDGCGEVSGTVTCSASAPLAAVDSVTITIPVRLSSPVASTFIDDGDATIINHATPDPEPANDSAAGAPQLDLTGDSDGDGITDGDEIDPAASGMPVDSDGDGYPDYLDEDSDNDGVSDAVEGGSDPDQDTDGDGVVDRLDLDSDADAIPDVVESGNGTLDTDGDGMIDGVGANDVDGNGWDDRASAPLDSDEDGTPDHLDEDSDGDGIADADEAGTAPDVPVDTDGDGTPDYLDDDTDGDGIPDDEEAGDPAPVDTDGDGTPDFRDLDSDDDDVPDAEEGTADDDGDGDANWRDPEGHTITGQVFHDRDRDATRETDEPDVSAVTVRLIAAGSDGRIGTSDDVEVQSAITASPYTFANVGDGDYLVRVDLSSLPSGAGPTGDAGGGTAGEIALTVNGSDLAAQDFGVATAAVTGTVTDADGNPVANAVIVIVDAAGNEFTATTDASGTYVIESDFDAPLMPGTADVTATLPNGVQITASPGVVAGEELRLDLVALAQPDPEPEPDLGAEPTLPLTGTDADKMAVGGITLVLAGLWMVVASRWL